MTHTASPAEPRACRIARSRRSQPIAELERKACKARSTRGRVAEESKDLSFATEHVQRMKFRQDVAAREGLPRTFCYLCHGFAPAIGGVPAHTNRCTFSDPPPDVYAGTIACQARPAGRLP